tara:strand:+ start:358 stop:699 length:342 start_codon:yes stop_codon:yes gene_type:complete
MKTKMNMDLYHNILLLVLTIIVLFLSATNNRKVKKVSQQLTTGTVNIILILLIILLTATENIHAGLLLTLIFLLMLIRFNKREGFISGPSPLDCNTYGDSKKRNGTVYYPLNA